MREERKVEETGRKTRREETETEVRRKGRRLERDEGGKKRRGENFT